MEESDGEGVGKFVGSVLGIIDTDGEEDGTAVGEIQISNCWHVPLSS